MQDNAIRPVKGEMEDRVLFLVTLSSLLHRVVHSLSRVEDTKYANVKSV